MTRTMPGVRQLLSTGLTGLAGTACLACCAIPLLLAAGVLSGAGWAIAGQWMPGIALSLIVLAALAWWRTTGHRTHRIGCVGGENCSCQPR